MILRHGHYAVTRSDGVFRIIRSGFKRNAVVGIIAIATAIDVANPDGRICESIIIIISSVGVVLINAYSDGSSIISQNRSGDIIAAIHGMDAVAIDDGHCGRAAHIGHTAAAIDGTVNQ